MTLLNDAEIRPHLISWLNGKAIKPQLILNEVTISDGSARPDIIAIYSYSHCYEIKGDNDQIERISKQLTYYQASFKKNTLITTHKHLKKALDLKPLDFETNYWLAKLYITSAKKSLFFEIEEYLLRAAKIAEKNNNIYRASHCYLLIVQASIFSDKKHEGEKYIKLAEELTNNFAKVYYEKAKFLFSFDENIEAKQAIDVCLNIKMDFIEQINTDPFFFPYKNEIDGHFKEMKSKLYKTTEAILHNMQVEVHYFDVIYDMAKKVREFMDALLVTEKQRIDLGELDVLAIFRTEKNKQIVGGRVMDGKIEDGALGEIYRDNEKIGEGKVIGLEVSRKKADVAYKNSEAGLLFQGKEKVQEGDVLRFYKEEFIRPTI